MVESPEDAEPGEVEMLGQSDMPDNGGGSSNGTDSGNEAVAAGGSKAAAVGTSTLALALSFAIYGIF